MSCNQMPINKSGSFRGNNEKQVIVVNSYDPRTSLEDAGSLHSKQSGLSAPKALLVMAHG